MSLVGEIVVVGTVAAISAAIGLRHKWIEDRLRSAIVDVGMRWIDVDNAHGAVDGVPLKVAVERTARRGVSGVVLSLPAVPDTGLTLGPESLATHLAAAVTGGDLTLGEQRFDDIVRVHAADVARALSLLDGKARDAVIAAVTAGGVFTDDRWTLSRGAGPLGVRLDGLGAAVRALVVAHRALSAPQRAADVYERLRTLCRSDRSAWVRNRALRELTLAGQADEALLIALDSDLDGGVRLEALRARGERGRDGLMRLMADGSRTWRVRAAVTLAQLGPGTALNQVEDVLVGALADPELGEPAADALGLVGTPRCIGALAAADGGAARQAVRRALIAVRSRVPSEATGGLALAVGPSDGGLSLAGGDGEPRP